MSTRKRYRGNGEAGTARRFMPATRHKAKGAGVQVLEYVAFIVRGFILLTALHRRRRYDVVQLHDLKPEFYAGRSNAQETAFGSCWYVARNGLPACEKVKQWVA